MVLANVTLLAGDGAVTVTSSDWPFCIAVLVKLLVLADSSAVPSKLRPLIANVVATVFTTMLVDPVAPSAVAVNVAVPLPPATPVTVTSNLPFTSVVPDAGVKVTLPTPVRATLIAAPETGSPTAFNAV